MCGLFSFFDFNRVYPVSLYDEKIDFFPVYIPVIIQISGLSCVIIIRSDISCPFFYSNHNETGRKEYPSSPASFSINTPNFPGAWPSLPPWYCRSYQHKRCLCDSFQSRRSYLCRSVPDKTVPYLPAPTWYRRNQRHPNTLRSILPIIQ